MARIKHLKLENVYGYRNASFDFTNDNGIPRDLAMFFGPNGSGKSSALNIVQILGSPWRHSSRDMSMFFRKMAFHPDYNPSYGNFIPFKGTMRAQGIFATREGDKRVVIEYDSDKVAHLDKAYKLHQKGQMDESDLISLWGGVGVTVNELSRRTIDFDGGIYTPMEYAYFPDADHPMKTQKFQLHAECAEAFIDIAQTVYGYDCFLENEVTEIDRQRNKPVKFFTDFIIYKDFEGTRIHYKNMSAGEKKIATLLRLTLHPVHRAIYDIYLIDNISMHVYYLRHVAMLEKMREHLPEKQILATTHSGELIRHLGGSGALYDVVQIKQESRRYEPNAGLCRSI